MTVDVHAHLLERELLDTLVTTPNRMLAVERNGASYHITGYGEADPLLYDLDSRLADLASRGIDLQLVAPPPTLWSKPDWAAHVDESRVLNAATRRAVLASGGRLKGLAVVALGEPRMAVDELRRWLDDDAFAGVALPTSAAGEPLDDPKFAPLLACLSKHRTFAFMHSVTSERRPLLGAYTLNTAIGWPTETAIAIARLVFAGVLERHPLNLALSHGGGTLAWLAGRLDTAFHAPRYERNPACSASIAHPPSHYLRELRYDTVVTSAASLRFLIDSFGVDRVVFGSDFPYEIGDADGRQAQPVIDALSPADRAAVLHGNATRMLAHATHAR
jgi:aminocarboxymuconate-semialdehyde decarboxylase